MGSQHSRSKNLTDSIIKTKAENGMQFVPSNNDSHVSATIYNGGGASKDDHVNTSFKWRYGGNTVYLSGTFTNWKNHIALEKNGTEFSIILRLPKGIHQYKYLVDNEWRFSPDDPTAPDQLGNINNIIDTTKYDKTQSELYRAETSKSEKKSIGKEEIKSSVEFDKDVSRFLEDAPQLPPHLTSVYFLEEHKKHLWNMRNFASSTGNAEATEERRKAAALVRVLDKSNSLSPPTHVVLNHIGISKNSFNKTLNYNIFTITQRYKAKYCTIKFYCSKIQQDYLLSPIKFSITRQKNSNKKTKENYFQFELIQIIFLLLLFFNQTALQLFNRFLRKNSLIKFQAAILIQLQKKSLFIYRQNHTPIFIF